MNQTLTLYGVYNKRARMNKKHKLTPNSRFYQAHYVNNQRGYDFSPLQGQPVFTPEQIISEQKSRVLAWSLNKIYADELKELNTIIMTANWGDFNFEQSDTKVVEKAFQDFDDGLIGGFYNTKNKEQSYLDLANWCNIHDQQLQRLEGICAKLYAISKTNVYVPQNALIQFANILKDIRRDTEIGSQFLMNLHKTIPKGASYLQKNIGIGTELKGYLFEDEVYSFLLKHVPQGFQVVNTANILMESTDLFGNLTGNKSKQMRSDFGIISDEVANRINVEWNLNGKQYQGTLSEFINVCNAQNGQKVTIKITDSESAQKIRDNLIGIQAKSNLGKINFLKNSKTGRTISLSTVLDEKGNVAQNILWKLHHLVDLGGPYQAHLQDTNEIYDMYFNYALGKFLAEIIGTENKIMITRNGFQTVQDFLLDSFANNKYMRTENRVHIRYPDTSVTVSLK